MTLAAIAWSHSITCRNRHCPKCQGLDELRWVERQQQGLLPVGYHHVVFTVPEALHPLLRRSPHLGYGLLFAAVAETLQEVALRPKHLGARIRFSAVLHTWSQLLAYHPHIHCIVTGGGLSPDGSRWISAKPRFLFFVGVLARVFRGKLLHKLEQALDSGKLVDPDHDGHALLLRAARKDWMVYSKPPGFKGHNRGDPGVLPRGAKFTYRPLQDLGPRSAAYSTYPFSGSSKPPARSYPVPERTPGFAGRGPSHGPLLSRRPLRLSLSP